MTCYINEKTNLNMKEILNLTSENLRVDLPFSIDVSSLRSINAKSPQKTKILLIMVYIFNPKLI